MVSSSWGGILADRLGSRALLASGFALMLAGIACTLAAPLVAVGAGISLLTVGYFTAHSVASGTVGRLARSANGHASSLYLLFYYMGSSVFGSCGGWAWQRGGWPGVVALVAAVAMAGIALSAGAPRRVPDRARGQGTVEDAAEAEAAQALDREGVVRGLDRADRWSGPRSRGA
nr:MFS transporter [Aquisphaera giovannonii]